ncbi:MAG TPA: CoA transferase, partial [Usitatibacter sp.]|nr:CoA transferase [Usitatibacter sp.]
NWERIAEALGHPEWKADPRFATNTERMANLEALVDKMNAVLGTRTRAEWLEVLDAAGVPAGPVNDMEEALTHPQVSARGMVVEVESPGIGRYQALGCPIHFSATPATVRRGAPRLGEDTRSILGEAGYSEADIDAMLREGTLAEPGEAGDG